MYQDLMNAQLLANLGQQMGLAAGALHNTVVSAYYPGMGNILPFRTHETYLQINEEIVKWR